MFNATVHNSVVFERTNNNNIIVIVFFFVLFLSVFRLFQAIRVIYKTTLSRDAPNERVQRLLFMISGCGTFENCFEQHVSNLNGERTRYIESARRWLGTVVVVPQPPFGSSEHVCTSYYLSASTGTLSHVVTSSPCLRARDKQTKCDCVRPPLGLRRVE